MKTRIDSARATRSGYALFIVMCITSVSLIVLASTASRTYSMSKINDRHVELMMCQNAAEAAVESVFARMQYDFQSAGGPATVKNNLGSYRTFYPRSTNDAYWGQFTFSDGLGNSGATYVYSNSVYSGELPQAYAGRSTANAPVYRILSNTQLVGGNGVIGTAQEDVLLALVPLTAYAIFYNGLLEFSTCAPMTVNGPVHSNTNIYVGAGGGAWLTFNSTVTSAGIVSAPYNNGQSWGNATNFSSTWRTTFNANPKYINRVPTIQIPIPMTNTYSLLEVPNTNNYSSTLEQQRLYNKAAVIILVSNTSVTTIVQKPPTAASLAVEDGSKLIFTNSLIASSLATNLPFLSVSNRLYDRRESKTNYLTQVDLGKYKQWMSNTICATGGKYEPGVTTNYPTILYVADFRETNGLMFSVRITNGIAPPANGGLGFTLATPNPLYVLGHYNSPNAQGPTNTWAAGTVPCALMSDALTVLSSEWRDYESYPSYSYTSRQATHTTINAAILTGIVPSTTTATTGFSGGVHNLPRLLEDWNSPSSRTLTINTSMINLFPSRVATSRFINPGTYYDPPTRQFSYDLKFKDPTQTPPGMPCALVALRFGWATPPPNNVTYNVTP